MRIGLSLPTFTRDGRLPLDVARAAESAGLDGVFVFDHLFPIGQPARPALSGLPLLGAVAAATSTITVGSLVARVGLLDGERVGDALSTAAAVAGGAARLIAGVGAGDRMSAAENATYGLPFPPMDERLAALTAVVQRLAAAGLTTWVGGRSPQTRAVAAAHATALNLWGASVAQAAAEAQDVRARAGERPVGVTWGGQVLIGTDPDDLSRRLARYGERPGLVSGTVGGVAAHLRDLAAAASLEWVVCRAARRRR